ncbi:type VI secretion system-associated FHA domain protein TagH [Sphingomonas parva]|uniref:Type VI secretion system-associated FHA domain protein TagH n=1 Tax=Sphingomonas parva TaxID=2555898 RepID=A0A4Y8ZQQ5_9SPHN|nr:type VI secretion system-associated FHA domain protein TagH [Sphingomonas parva]TFI57612.1 type VI secretion system-associated FHA domain protein TagH [Sphingomonas parva]
MWILLLSRATDPPGSFIDRRQLDSGQVKIGRSAKTCDLVLPDTQGYVSREHCTISAQGIDLYVVDGSVNGVALNHAGQRIVPNTPVAIRPNDRLLIGDFVITIATESAAAGLVPTPAPPPLPGGPSPPRADSWFDTPIDPIWDAGQASAAVQEFLGNAMNDFLAPARTNPEPASRISDFGFGDPIGEAFSRPIMADPLPPPADFAIPEDWAATPAPRGRAQDPSAAPAASQSASGPSALDPFASDPFAANPFDADPFAAGAPRPDPFSAAPEASLPGGGRGAHPAPLFPPPPPETPPAASPGADPFDRPAFSPDANDPLAGFPPSVEHAIADGASAPPPPAAPVATTQADAPDAAWNAFYEGAGLSPDELRLSSDAMYRLGVLYRQVVLGLWDLIHDRAAFKDEFRVERTQLSIGKNNPLKHLPPLEAAKFLLGEPLPGFMSTEETVRTAFEDIKKHQLAMLAGVQHAMAAVFDRLSPAEIDKLIEKAGEKKHLSFWRGIDRWTVYQTVFEALRRDAVSNANGVMSVAFREGYEKFLKSGR